MKKISHNYQVQGQPLSAGFRLTASAKAGEAHAQRIQDFVNVQTRLFDTLVSANDTILDRRPEDPEVVEIDRIRANLVTDSSGVTRVSAADYSNLPAMSPPHWQDDVSFKMLPDGTLEWNRKTTNQRDVPERETIRYNPAKGTLTVIQ